jgi:hypothetical protein
MDDTMLPSVIVIRALFPTFFRQATATFFSF